MKLEDEKKLGEKLDKILLHKPTTQNDLKKNTGKKKPPAKNKQ